MDVQPVGRKPRRQVFSCRSSFSNMLNSVHLPCINTVPLLQTGGDGLDHFMTLILVFMGSPERMKNPHLRAELAETLAALMPQNPDHIEGRQGILSKYVP